MATDDLTKLNDVLDGLIESLAPTARKDLAKDISRQLRTAQAARIKSNRSPDGNNYQERKKPKSKREIKFIYSGNERHLKSWRSTKRYIIGFDRFRGGIRTFKKDRIARYIKIDTSVTTGNERRSKARDRMFVNLIKNRWLKAKASPNEATVQFESVASNVARIHHYGLRDRVGSQEIKYHKRELLGLTPKEVSMIENSIVNHLSKRGL
ncbi:MAG: phage virion morphogenesis protein [Enterovibrio sp.]